MWFFLLLLLLAAPASAQSVRQSGNVTPGHGMMWQGNGVATDAGTAAQGNYSSLGTTGSGPTICTNSAPITGPYNRVCLGASSSGGQILFSNQGGATGGLSFNINGVIYNFPFSTGGVLGPGSSVIGHFACWNNTSGTLLSDCTGGGGGTPGGSNTEVQFNNSGSFGADAGFTYGSGVAGLGVPGVQTGGLELTTATGGTVEISATASTASYTLTLPTSTGTTGQILTTTVSGGVSTLSWTNPSSSVGGSNTDVQFNSSGAFGGDSGFTYAGSGSATLGNPGTSTGKLTLGGATAGDIVLQAPANITTTYNLVLPAAPGTTGQVLAGTVVGSTVTLSWVTNGGGGGGSCPGGANTEVQFNSSSACAGDAGFTYFGGGTAFLGEAGTFQGILGLAGSTSGDVSLSVATTTATYNYLLPSTEGTTGEYLTETVSGGNVITSWTTLTLTVGTTIISGGTNGDIEYNNSGVLGEKSVTGTGSVVLATGPTMSSVDITSATLITGLPTPVNASDAATKSYVDSTSSGLIVHTAVQWATAAVLPNSPTYANGTAGVGATLTAGSNAAISVDGNSPSLNDRVLVKNQSSGLQNGVYTVTTVGSGSAAWVLTRATDFNAITAGYSGGSCTPAASCIAPDSYFFVTGGATNANSGYVLSNASGGTLTVGTTAITFSQFSAGTANAMTSSGGPINFTGTPTANQIPIASSASVGAWTTLYTQPINVLSYGADNTGTNDSATAINNALAALASPGACLYFPGGRYKVASKITYSLPAGATSVCITGDGMGATVLFWPNANGGLLLVESSYNQSIQVTDLSLKTQQAGGGTALNVTQSQPLTHFGGNLVRNVFMGPDTDESTTQTWNDGIVWNDVSGTVVDNVIIYGPACTSSCTTTVGIQYEGTAKGSESIYHFVTNSKLQQLTNDISINAYVQSVQVMNTNMENGQQCTGGTSASCGSILIGGTCPANDDRTQFTFVNNLIQNDFGGAGILVKCPVDTITAIGNLFSGSAGNIDLYINAAAGIAIIADNSFFCGSTGTCIQTSGAWANIHGNWFESATTGINFTSGGSFNTEYGNQFVTVTNGVVDSQSTAQPALPFQTNAPLSVSATAQTNNIDTSYSAHFGANIANTHGSAGDHGIALFAGANGASDSSTIMIDFISGNGSNTAGSVTRSGTGVAYNTTSDLRLKTDIVPTSRGLAELLRIPVMDFSYKADPEHKILQGLIAQYVMPVYPEAVRPGGDNPYLQPWVMDYGRLTPLIVKSIQELDTHINRRIYELEERLEALERRLH